MEKGTTGPHNLAAVLAGFRLLNAVWAYDQQTGDACNSATVRDRLVPMHLKLLEDRDRLATLLQYILYPNMDLQYEVRLLHNREQFLALVQQQLDGHGFKLLEVATAKSMVGVRILAVVDPAAHVADGI